MPNNGPWPEWRLAPCGTPAAYRRHHRRGEPIDEACRHAARTQSAGRKGYVNVGAQVPDHREIRNGIPWKPYVYQGLGYDIYEQEETAC